MEIRNYKYLLFLHDVTGTDYLVKCADKLRYTSTSQSAAKFSKRGEIKAVNPGSCKVCVQTIKV